MIESVHFTNFKLLQDATLPLSRLTLLVGPNASGKSTALHGLQTVAQWKGADPLWLTHGADQQGSAVMGIELRWGAPYPGARTMWQVRVSHGVVQESFRRTEVAPGAEHTGQPRELEMVLSRFRIYSLNPPHIAETVTLQPNATLEDTGRGLPGVLDRMRDEDPERFEAFNVELRRWLPEYDRVLFGTPESGKRTFTLRTREGFQVGAADISHGTLSVLAIIALGYAYDTPRIFAIEEPERGIHPRLLRDIRDALWRLTHPEDFGDDRTPSQVIVTTHSPYLLDLFRDTPEDIVIADRQPAGGVRFARLSDRADLGELLREIDLGEAWYSGVLGGVPPEG